VISISLALRPRLTKRAVRKGAFEVFTIDALNRIMTDDGPNITMVRVRAVFEADLALELYAYRPERNAQQAVTEVEE